MQEVARREHKHAVGLEAVAVRLSNVGRDERTIYTDCLEIRCCDQINVG